MLDGLLGSGFKAKCKSEIKLIKARIDIARRRAEAKQRFLKDDLAKLLVNGLDVDAFNRTEEYLAGQNILASYDFIEQTCEYITGQLSCMQKQRECPEECREAVGSLMFAAARFSDLPELRDLRNLLRERYGNSLECFVNQTFHEKLYSRPPERERKIMLLEDISSEYSLKWDAKGFEKRMVPPSATAAIQSQSSKHGSNYVALKEYNQLIKNGSAKPSNLEYPTTNKMSELANAAANGGDKSAERTFYLREDSIAEPKKQDVLRQKHSYVSNGERKHSYREAFSKEEYSTIETDMLDVAMQRPELVKAKDQVQKSKDVEYLRRKKPDIHNSNIMEGRSETLNNEILFHNAKEAKVAEKFKSNHAKDDSCQKSVRSRRPHDTKRSHNVDTRFLIQNNVVNNISNGNSEITPFQGQSPVGRHDLPSTPNYISERDVEIRTSGMGERVPVPPYSRSSNSMLQPPYTKPRDSEHKSTGVSRHANSEYNFPSGEPSSQNRDHAVDLSESILKQGVQRKQEEGIAEGVPLKTHYLEDHLDHKGMIPLPKPRSIRRKHRRSSHQNEVSSTEDVEPIRRTSNSRRRECSRKGLQILFDGENPKKDKEEKDIDKMLLHYCKKPSNFDLGKLRPKSTADPAEQRAVHAAASSHDQRNYVHDEGSEHVQVPTRSFSLPHKPTSPPRVEKAFNRVNSFQPDNQARHVHPKLPDYEDFVERMATLRGK